MAIEEVKGNETQQSGEQGDKLKGVFSATGKKYVGTGTTRRKVEQLMYYYAEEHEESMVCVQPLNLNWVPTTPKKRIKREEFMAVYTAEPDIYTEKTIPALKQLQKTLAKAEGFRKRGEPYSAEFEFQNALKMDANNIRGLFGLGLTYLERGETEKGHDVFTKLVKLEEAFGQENKHLFNEFGMKLRKNNMLDQALTYYTRAFKQDRKDENLLYNIARTLVEKNEYKKAAVCLKQALDLRKDFHEARKLLKWIITKVKKAKASA